MGSQTVGHDLATEQQQTLFVFFFFFFAKSGSLSSGIIKIKENDYKGLSVAPIRQVLCGGTY